MWLTSAHETVPTPLSIAQVSAFARPLHDNEEAPPAGIDAGLASNEPIVTG
jgi:hypothetical protein